jgi:hypothetical protein
VPQPITNFRRGNPDIGRRGRQENLPVGLQGVTVRIGAMLSRNGWEAESTGLDGVDQLGNCGLSVAIEHARVVEVEQPVLDA